MSKIKQFFKKYKLSLIILTTISFIPLTLISCSSQKVVKEKKWIVQEFNSTNQFKKEKLCK